MKSVDSAHSSVAGYSGAYALWDVLRYLLAYVGWGLMIALVASAACWCCGNSAYAAYLKLHRPVRRPRIVRAVISGAIAPSDVAIVHPSGELDDQLDREEIAVRQEVARGLVEVEAFLALH